jgi:hypothetical protein
VSRILPIFFVLALSFPDRGDLISTQVVSTKDIDNNQLYIENELSVLASGDFFNLTVEYGYWMYNITYETIDKYGIPTQASGVIAYPRSDWPNEENQAYPILSYQHGTVIEKTAVTSSTGIWILPALIAGYGYVYLEPDYLGLGISEGLHPYQIKDPYASDVVDFLRAADHFSNQNDDFQINSQIFLSGYSEGGYATMAAHQIIERDYADEINITASFPMAGAYDMSGIMTDVMLDYTSYGQPYYFPYVLFSYADSYQNTIGPAENYLLSEYASTLADLFDGLHSADEINDIMPDIPITIMIPDSITTFEENENHPLRLALQENNLYDWTPQSTMHIIHGLADELVPFENSQLAYDTFIANGAEDVTLTPIPESFGGHQDAAPFALLGAFELSQELKIINELGDFNEDGALDILDVIGIVNYIIQTENNNYHLWASDINVDNNIDVLDIIYLINIILNS